MKKLLAIALSVALVTPTGLIAQQTQGTSQERAAQTQTAQTQPGAAAASGAAVGVFLLPLIVGAAVVAAVAVTSANDDTPVVVPAPVATR